MNREGLQGSLVANLTRLRSWFLIALVFSASAWTILACDPAVPTRCQAYSRADAVFIGTLMRIENLKDSNAEFDAHFWVNRTFKGKTGVTEVVRFSRGDCQPEISEIGKDYFVYKEPYSRRSANSIANLTNLLANASSSLEYAESLSDKDPIYKIGGLVTGLSQDELGKVVLTIGAGQNRESVALDKHGFFELTLRKPGDYTLKITLPFKARFTEKVLATQRQSEGTSIEYTLPFEPNACDYREIEIDRSEQ